MRLRKISLRNSKAGGVARAGSRWSLVTPVCLRCTVLQLAYGDAQGVVLGLRRYYRGPDYLASVKSSIYGKILLLIPFPILKKEK